MDRRLLCGASDKIVSFDFAVSLRRSDPNPKGAVWAELAPPCSPEEKSCL